VKLCLHVPYAFIMWYVVKNRDNFTFVKFITLNKINISSKGPIPSSLCDETSFRKNIVLFNLYVKSGLYWIYRPPYAKFNLNPFSRLIGKI
jgi:hypothetical protein